MATTKQRVGVTVERTNAPPRAGRLATMNALEWIAIVQALALAVVVGWDGAPVWRVVRMVAVAAITSLALIGMRRSTRAGRGAIALVLGVAGTVAGGGVASAHLARDGITVTSVAASIVLSAGLALLILGSVALIRSLRRWWRLLAVPAGLALLVFVLYPLTLAVNATNRPAGQLGSRTPADVGLQARDITFSTPDGARMSAWYAPGSNGAAVVVLHGSGSTRTAVLDHAAVLASHGYATLLVDARGHGRSEGRAMDFGWYSPQDIAGAVSFLGRQPGVDRVGVLGSSMGGEGAISAAGSDPRIAAVVAEGVTGMQEADHGWLPGGINGTIERGLEWVQYTAADLMSGAGRPMPMRDAIVAAAPRPFFLIQAETVSNEVDAGAWFRAVSPRTVDVWIVPGAGHTEGLAIDPTGWEERVIEFLDEALLAG